jgi:hypothetical protein
MMAEMAEMVRSVIATSERVKDAAKSNLDFPPSSALGLMPEKIATGYCRVRQARRHLELSTVSKFSQSNINNTTTNIQHGQEEEDAGLCKLCVI